MSRKQLEQLLKDHRRNHQRASVGCGRWTYACVCGATLSSNSHHTQAAHIADVIIAAGWTPPVPPAIDPITDN